MSRDEKIFTAFIEYGGKSKLYTGINEHPRFIGAQRMEIAL
jgi:hypothetical protein